jgi:hypothetical protein
MKRSSVNLRYTERTSQTSILNARSHHGRRAHAIQYLSAGLEMTFSVPKTKVFIGTTTIGDKALIVVVDGNGCGKG